MSRDLIDFLGSLDVETLSMACEDLKYGLVIEDGKITDVVYE